MKYLGLFLLFISTNLIAETVVKDGCVECGKDPLAKGEVEKALGVDPSKIEVPKLKYKGFLSVEDLIKYDSKTISQLLVERIKNGCDVVREEKGQPEIGDYSEIMLFVNEGLWDSISKYGFQNQHTTRSTRGSTCIECRLKTETILIGNTFLGYGPKSKDILPKYSALNVKKLGYFSNTNAPTGYGNTAVVLKRSVHSRATITKYDSLGSYFLGNSFNFNNPANPDGENTIKCKYGYCEAQIWGELSLNDVEYLLIQKGTEVPNAFKERGIPVYYVKRNTITSVGWEKGKIAFNPNLEKTKPKVPKITKECSGCNSVVQRIHDHHHFPNWGLDELKSRYASEAELGIKREILGEIILRGFESEEEKVKFLEAEYKAISKKAEGGHEERAGIMASTIIQGLASIELSKSNLKNMILDVLKKNDHFKAEPLNALIFSIALELPALKEDKDFANEIIEHFDSLGYLPPKYYSLISDKSDCDEVPKNYLELLKKHYGVE